MFSDVDVENSLPSVSQKNLSEETVPPIGEKVAVENLQEKVTEDVQETLREKVSKFEMEKQKFDEEKMEFEEMRKKIIEEESKLQKKKTGI